MIGGLPGSVLTRFATRKALLVFLSFLLSLVLPIHSALGDGTGDTERPFTLSREQQTKIAEEANRLYSVSLSLDAVDRKEHLERAYEKYQLLANTGQVSPELFFNLGNSALQLERYGHAVAYFEQARRLSPSDGAIAKNLRFARSKLDPEQTFGAWTEATEFNLSMKWFAWWTAVIAWCSFWLVVGLQYFKRPLSRAAYYWLRNGAMVVFVLAAASLLLSARYVATYDAIVLQNDIDLRQGDGEVFGSNGSLSSGSRVRVLEQRGDWCKVGANGTTGRIVGWVRDHALLKLRG